MSRIESEEPLAPMDLGAPRDDVLGVAISGLEEEPAPRWARPARARLFPKAWPMTAGKLAEYFPQAFVALESEMPKTSPLGGFHAADGRSPIEQWQAFVKKLERLQFEIDQQGGSLIVTLDKLSGRGKPVAMPCRRCGATDQALTAGVCFSGCEVSS